MTMSTDNRATVTLPTDEQILIEREFYAPRHLVFRAYYTTPELVRRWWHAKRGEMTVVEIDLRVGGRWRCVVVTFDGTEVGFHGEYREIVTNQRIVSTEVFEGLPAGLSEADAATLNTATFSETEGRTTLRILVEAKSRTSRDAIIASGMEARTDRGPGGPIPPTERRSLKVAVPPQTRMPRERAPSSRACCASAGRPKRACRASNLPPPRHAPPGRPPAVRR
jgi:uncharacterized protein YndB with AHSA1/START domain